MSLNTLRQPRFNPIRNRSLARRLQVGNTPLLFLSTRAFFLRIVLADEAEETTFDGNIDIFRKPFDELVCLRQRRSTLEGQVIVELFQREQPLQAPADPEILLDHLRAQTEPGAACSKYTRRSSLGSRAKSSTAQSALSDKWRKIAPIQAGA